MHTHKEGILLINKPRGKTAFSLVAILRKRLGIKTIGHAGTLDPFATGVMVMLIGRPYTRLSDRFLNQDKEYLAEIKLGESTDSYDCDGIIQNHSDKVPTLEEIEAVVATFQGEIDQVPPMFSAKKIDGKKLYELARQGKTVERAAVRVKVDIQILSYVYPHLTVKVACSKGTYVRSLAHEIGEKLGSWGHLSALERLRSGPFRLEECITLETFDSPDFDLCQSKAFMKAIPN